MCNDNSKHGKAELTQRQFSIVNEYNGGLAHSSEREQEGLVGMIATNYGNGAATAGDGVMVQTWNMGHSVKRDSCMRGEMGWLR